MLIVEKETQHHNNPTRAQNKKRTIGEHEVTRIRYHGQRERNVESHAAHVQRIVQRAALGQMGGGGYEGERVREKRETHTDRRTHTHKEIE
jgi:hypothetical protein